LDILHLAAPCRNVPVTFTLTRKFMEPSTDQQSLESLGERVDLASALDRARGGVAVLWEYRVSLSELTVRVSFAGRWENLHFVMNGCIRVEASTSWSNPVLAVEEDGCGRIQVADRSGGFLVMCSSVRAFSNVEPLFGVVQ